MDVFKLEIQIDAAMRNMKATWYRDKEFHEAMIGVLGNQYGEIERNFDSSISNAVRQYMEQSDLLLREKSKETDDEQA